MLQRKHLYLTKYYRELYSQLGSSILKEKITNEKENTLYLHQVAR